MSNGRVQSDGRGPARRRRMRQALCSARIFSGLAPLISPHPLPGLFRVGRAPNPHLRSGLFRISGATCFRVSQYPFAVGLAPCLRSGFVSFAVGRDVSPIVRPDLFEVAGSLLLRPRPDFLAIGRIISPLRRSRRSFGIRREPAMAECFSLGCRGNISGDRRRPSCPAVPRSGRLKA
jgi:hypothetical protein